MSTQNDKPETSAPPEPIKKPARVKRETLRKLTDVALVQAVQAAMAKAGKA